MFSSRENTVLGVLGVQLRGLGVTLRNYLIYIGVRWRLGATLDGMDIMDGIFLLLEGGEGNLPIPAECLGQRISREG
jgi:hypothetical protein